MLRIESGINDISTTFLTLLSPAGAVLHHCRCASLPLPGCLHLDVLRRAAPLPHRQEPQGGQLQQHRQIQEEVHVPFGLWDSSSDCGCVCIHRTQKLWNTFSVSMMSAFNVEAVSMPIHDLKSKYVSLKIHFPIVNDTSNQSFLKPEFYFLLGMPRAVVLSILGVGCL